MTSRIPTPQIIGDFAIFKTSLDGIWVVRDLETRVEVAHELSQRDAIKAARMHMARKQA